MHAFYLYDVERGNCAKRLQCFDTVSKVCKNSPLTFLGDLSMRTLDTGNLMVWLYAEDIPEWQGAGY